MMMRFPPGSQQAAAQKAARLKLRRKIIRKTQDANSVEELRDAILSILKHLV